MRATRSMEKKRKLDEDIVEPPKEKKMTLGKYLALERQAKEEKLMENESVTKYEQFEDYDKEIVISAMSATEVNPEYFTEHDFYKSAGEDGAVILFLTLRTGRYPSTFTHFCNNSSLKWNVQHLHIKSSTHSMALSNVVMVFVRGEHVEGTTMTGNTYKYLGLVGVQSTSSENVEGCHEYVEVTLVFDYSLNKKELAQFGDSVLKCKKNKYGCSLCARPPYVYKG